MNQSAETQLEPTNDSSIEMALNRLNVQSPPSSVDSTGYSEPRIPSEPSELNIDDNFSKPLKIKLSKKLTLKLEVWKVFEIAQGRKGDVTELVTQSLNNALEAIDVEEMVRSLK